MAMVTNVNQRKRRQMCMKRFVECDWLPAHRASVESLGVGLERDGSERWRQERHENCHDNQADFNPNHGEDATGDRLGDLVSISKRMWYSRNI